MEIKQNVKVTGEITAKFYDQSTITSLERFINRLILKLRNRWPKIVKYYRLGRLITIDEHNNVICNAGFSAITKILVGDTGYTGNGEINKMALGTGSGTPAASDTTLSTESYRNDTISGTSSSNVAYLTGFYSESECNGTYTEFGNFIDGGAGADSGLLWSHVGSLNWVKSSLVVLVISCKYTFASN